MALTLCMLGIISFFLPSADFFSVLMFLKNLSGIQSEFQTDWIQIRPDFLSALIWVQTVCKCDQQTRLVGKELIYIFTP